MFRLLTILLLLAGLGLIILGGNRYLESRSGETAQAPAPVTEEAAAPDDAVDGEPRSLLPEGRRSAPGGDVQDGGFEAMMDTGDDTFGTARATSPMMQRLRSVPIAHETPTSASYNRAFEVTVAIDATGDDTAADALPGEGNIMEGEAQVLDKAQATLSGSAFDIEPISPAIQTVSPVTENVWRWKVKPVETGTHELRIELFALENDEALPIRTFTDRVEVKVSRLGQVIAAADEFDPLFMVVGGIGSLLGGLFGVFRFFRRR
ncbi:hypothetical protein [Henriciella aquimarina]|uniref:hypothetical protein n=1 Tax=Henriciella aquimarina TaxID=545261 RepID=UPI000A054622|nr:hypothetical protein [Henriciella aquimarina]